MVKNDQFSLTCSPYVYLRHHPKPLLPLPSPEFRKFLNFRFGYVKKPIHPQPKIGPSHRELRLWGLPGCYRLVSYVRLNYYIPVISTLFDITKPTIIIKSTYFRSLSKINTLRYDQWLWGNRSFYIYNRVITDILLLKLPQSLNQSQVVML